MASIHVTRSQRVGIDPKIHGLEPVVLKETIGGIKNSGKTNQSQHPLKPFLGSYSVSNQAVKDGTTCKLGEGKQALVREG